MGAVTFGILAWRTSPTRTYHSNYGESSKEEEEEMGGARKETPSLCAQIKHVLAEAGFVWKGAMSEGGAAPEGVDLLWREINSRLRSETVHSLGRRKSEERTIEWRKKGM